MELLDFMNSHSNWEKYLNADPYFISTHQDGDYYILKYEQFWSNFNFKMVREARGSIFRFDEESQKWICVCYPFDKFFNYGEQYSDVREIDWEHVYVQQKVDGSLIKFWYDRDEWHISTNGTIDAFKAYCGDFSYGELVSRAIATMPNFWYKLDTNYCYMFELTSPYNRIVVPYDGISLWYLGRRNISNQNEDRKHLNIKGLKYPAMYPYHSLAECVSAAHNMGVDEEGYVVCDKEFHRIKVKGDEYLRLHKLRGNGALTVLRVIEMWQNGSLDDFVAYFPEFQDFVNNVIHVIRKYIALCDTAFAALTPFLNNRKDFAINAQSYLPIIRNYLFARLDNKVPNPYVYFLNTRPRSLATYILPEIKQNSVGVNEDE